MRELSYPRKFPAFSPLIMFDAGGKSTYPLDCFGAFADEFRGFEIIVFHDVVRIAGLHHEHIDASESTYSPCFPFVFVSFALVVVTLTMSLNDGFVSSHGGDAWLKSRTYRRFSG